MSAVRSMTFTPSAFSRLRCCDGESSSSKMTTFASEFVARVDDLVDLALADVGGGVRLVELLDGGADDFRAGRAGELGEFGYGLGRGQEGAVKVSGDEVGTVDDGSGGVESSGHSLAV